MKLTDKQIQAAITYNRARAYTKDVWCRVQERLGIGVDGDPVRDTALAVAGFQEAHGLTVDGKAGPATLEALTTMAIESGPILYFPSESAFFFPGKLAVDADGAPNAYNESDTGIDYLRNAGKPGNWWALACDKQGTPYRQTQADPCPGYYVSTTALCDSRYPVHDPRRYVDSTKIPYIVLPRNLADLHKNMGPLRKGDVAAVLRAGKPETLTFAIYADVGPRWEEGKIPGEGSIALAQALGHNPFYRGRCARGISSGVFYVVFPGSGTGKPLAIEEITRRGQDALAAWGGPAKLARAMAAASAG